MTALGWIAAALSLGLAGFWAIALSTGALAPSREPWPGFLDHERPFVVPDLALAATLAAVAWLDRGGAPTAPVLAAAAGGALCFLGALDAGYLVGTWGRRTPPQRARTAVVSAVAAGAGVALVTLALGSAP